MSLQDMANGHLDVKALGEAANGDENTIVTTRTGKTYPSAERAINIMFQNGGLPATPFKTKELMTASALVDGQYAMVTDDTVNNGLYVKTAGAWVKSDYDPLSQAKTYADIATEATVNHIEEKTAPLITSAGKALHQWVDADLNIVAEIDANAELNLTGLDSSVQDEIKRIKDGSSKLTSNINNYAHVFTDDNDDVLGGFDIDGGLRATGMTVSVQEYLDIRKEPTPTRNYTNKDLFTDASNKYFLNIAVSNVKNAPAPFGMLPQRYTMPDAVVNEVSLPNATDYIPLDTTYGKNDKVVHPYVIEFKNLFRGFRYLLCITPYSQESNENPTIFGSKDMANWKILTGFAQPIATPMDNKFLSDNGFCYDPLNGMLICYWRESFVGSTGSKINYRATRDGIDWTDSALLLEPDVTSLHLSPSILFNPNDGLWHMWIGVQEGTFRHYTAKHLNNGWTLKLESAALFDWWHAEVKWVGDKYVMLVNARNDPSNLYFAVSSDGDTWIRGSLLWSTAQNAIYKGSFLPKFNALGQVAFDVFYTTNHAADPEKHRKFYHLTTNYSVSTITEI